MDDRNATFLQKIWSIENRTRYFFHCLGVLAVLALVVFTLTLIGSYATEKKEEKVAKRATQNPFENITLEAKSAMVWDVVGKRVLFSKNADVALPLASLTKVMTAVTAESALKKGENIKIQPEFLTPEGDSQLVVGDTWSAEDLRDFTLITSSNDGAVAVAAILNSPTTQAPENSNENHLRFIKAMNTLAREIGLEHSAFFNEHGLDQEADRGGAYGSARDMATLFSYALREYPNVLEATRYKNLVFASNEKTYIAENTNTAIDNIPNLIASKTGFTDLAGGNLVIAYDAGLNRPIIISVLGSTQEGRFSDTLALVHASLQYIKDNK